MIYRHKWKDHEALYFFTNVGLFNLKIFECDGRKVACLYDLIVFPEFRGEGQGRSLMRIAQNLATENGCETIYLWTDCEPWVMEWYNRLGFVPDAEMKSYAGEPALALKLK